MEFRADKMSAAGLLMVNASFVANVDNDRPLYGVYRNGSADELPWHAL